MTSAMNETIRTKKFQSLFTFLRIVALYLFIVLCVFLLIKCFAKQKQSPKCDNMTVNNHHILTLNSYLKSADELGVVRKHNILYGLDPNYQVGSPTLRYKEMPQNQALKVVDRITLVANNFDKVYTHENDWLYYSKHALGKVVSKFHSPSPKFSREIVVWKQLIETITPSAAIVYGDEMGAFGIEMLKHKQKVIFVEPRTRALESILLSVRSIRALKHTNWTILHNGLHSYRTVSYLFDNITDMKIADIKLLPLATDLECIISIPLDDLKIYLSPSDRLILRISFPKLALLILKGGINLLRTHVVYVQISSYNDDCLSEIVPPIDALMEKYMFKKVNTHQEDWIFSYQKIDK